MRRYVMVSVPDRPRAVPPVRTCGSYHRGHDVHFIQVRLSFESGPGQRRTVANVDDDGTIRFVTGEPVWHHDPGRLKAVLNVYGPEARMDSYGVLRVPTERGAYCFSVATEPDPCRTDTLDARPGESIVEEVLRRGGTLRRLPLVVEFLAEQPRPDGPA
jgi:hypothetical protein